MVITLLVYLLVAFLLLIFLIIFSVYTISLIYSSIKGSPYVATRKKRIEEILKEANLKRGRFFVELGSGDGRIVRTAVRKYNVHGVGIDINPLLVLWSKILGNKNIDFRVENIFDTDLRQADYLYLFLMPKLISELKKKMEKELKPGSLVISHGFPVIGWENKLTKKLEVSPFPTYFYKLK